MSYVDVIVLTIIVFFVNGFLLGIKAGMEIMHWKMGIEVKFFRSDEECEQIEHAYSRMRAPK